MLATFLHAIEHVRVAGLLAVFVDVDQCAIDKKPRQHFVFFFRHQGVCLTGRLEYMTTLSRSPIVLQVPPRALDYIAVHGGGVTMTANDALASHAQYAGPVAMSDIQ